jgi:hypothetical protein
MSLEFYLPDDATLATTHAFPSTVPGAYSATWTLHLWADKGLAGNVYRTVRFRVQAEVSAGAWADTGAPIVDRQEIEYRIVDSANPLADPLFIARAVTGWKPLGDGSLADNLGDIRGNCALYLEFRYQPSVEADSVSNWRIPDPTFGSAAIGRSDHTGACGIVTGLGNPNTTEWNDAPTVLQSGTPDALANIGARSWVYAGVDVTQTSETASLNQNDYAVAALTTGQAYYALISQNPAGTVVTVTKGLKAVAAVAVEPVMPAGHLPVAAVLVHYSASTSVIVNTNITVLAVDGRGLLTYSSGSLNVTVGAYKALCPDVYAEQSALSTVALTASQTNLVYVTPLGGVAATIAATIPLGGLALWSCVTDGSGVTSTPTDLRVLFTAGLIGPTGLTGPAGDNYSTTSTTSLAIGTGSKAFTVAAGLSFSAGQRVRAASAGGITNYMEGQIASYASTTLTVTVDRIGGSGTLADWNIGAAGDPGATGSAGTVGNFLLYQIFS